jgi:hypothetical protein
MTHDNSKRVIPLEHGATIRFPEGDELVIAESDAPLHGSDIHRGLSHTAFAGTPDVLPRDFIIGDRALVIEHGADIRFAPGSELVIAEEVPLDAPATAADLEGLYRTLARGYTGATADEAEGVFRTLGRGHKRGTAKRRTTKRRTAKRS